MQWHTILLCGLVLHRDPGKTPVLRHVVDELYRRMAETGLGFFYAEVFLFVMPFFKAEEDKHCHKREYGRQGHRVHAMSSESPFNREAGHLMAGAAARIVPTHGHVTAMSLNQEVSDIWIVGDPDQIRGIEVRTGVTRGVAKLLILPVGHMNGVAV